MTSLDKQDPLDTAPPLYRIGAQVSDHETRIALLERDYQEIKALRTDMQQVQIELTAVKTGLQSLPERIKELMHSEILGHEKVEARSQNAMIWKVLFMTFSFIGAVAYLVSQHLLDKAL